MPAVHFSFAHMTPRIAAAIGALQEAIDESEVGVRYSGLALPPGCRQTDLHEFIQGLEKKQNADNPR